MSEPGTRQIGDELEAIKAVAEALEPLGPDARLHVIEYVTQALAIPTSHTSQGARQHEAPRPGETPAPSEGAPAQHVTDIRTLKDEKKPQSANEMAALVAYYVSELLPATDRRAYITTADVDKYFKQANFPLPSRVAMTLPNAASAGYFDSVGRGQWRLNPVGYNLVAHGMPTGSTEAAPAKRTRRSTATKRTAKKAARKPAKMRQSKAAKASKRKATKKKSVAKRQ